MNYHIVPQTICSAAILNPTNLTSKEGQKLRFDCNETDHILVNGIVTSQTDILGSNGVIHVIDDILLPDSG